MTMLQLQPPLPLITPKGKANAHVLIDPGIESHLYWVVFLENGECWTFRNPEVRLQDNPTEGRVTAPVRSWDESKALAERGVSVSGEPIDYRAVYNEKLRKEMRKPEGWTPPDYPMHGPIPGCSVADMLKDIEPEK